MLKSYKNKKLLKICTSTLKAFALTLHLKYLMNKEVLKGI